jgi:hypothetical protein
MSTDNRKLGSQGQCTPICSDEVAKEVEAWG